MKTTIWTLCLVMLVGFAAPAAAENEAGEKPDLSSLGWLAGTRHIAREDGTIAYETWTGPTGGVVSAALTSAIVDEGSLRAYTDTLLEWVADKAQSEADLARTWLALHEVRATADEPNLTPLQTATKLFATLQDGVKAVSA